MVDDGKRGEEEDDKEWIAEDDDEMVGMLSSMYPGVREDEEDDAVAVKSARSEVICRKVSAVAEEEGEEDGDGWGWFGCWVGGDEPEGGELTRFHSCCS